MKPNQLLSYKVLATTLLIATFNFSPAIAQQSAASDISSKQITTKINELVKPAVDRDLFSGMILVSRGDNILYHEAFGYANWELNVPNTPDHRFGVGSITKPMTSTLVEILQNENRLSLDTPVEQFIKDFPNGPNGGVPTVGDLYNHRAGVPHRVTEGIQETQSIDASGIVERVKENGLLFEPGSQRLYSSAGFTVLARVIEIIENKPFEQILNERIFKPAKMTSALSETGRQLLTNRVYPYFLGTDDDGAAVVNAPYKNLRFLTGAGSVYATTEDLFLFLRAMHDGIFGDQLWDQAADADATTWRGWVGRTNGYEAYMDVLPAEDLSLIMLTNLRSAATWQIRAQIRALLIGEETQPFKLPPPVTKHFESPESLIGMYNSNGNQVEISIENGKLFRGENEFYPIEGEQYYIPASGTIMKFRRNKSGKVDAIIEPQSDELLPRIISN